jgi:hypothetical protein
VAIPCPSPPPTKPAINVRLATLAMLLGMFTLSACGLSSSLTDSESGSTPEATPQPAMATPTPTPVPTEIGEAQAESTATLAPSPAQTEVTMTAGNPDLDYAQVIFVRATQNSGGLWKFDTTVRHNDQGWDNYADAWQVVDPTTGQILAERILLHPHDNEQPFTRSQSNIEIPPDVTQVIVRAKDNVEGFGGQEVLVDLTVAQDEHFKVIRPE